MKTGEVTKVLKRLGWSAFTDDVGDKYTQFRLSDRAVQINYRVRKHGQEQQLDATLSTSTDAFSNSCKDVDPGYGAYAPLIRSPKGLCYQFPLITEDHVRQASDDAIEWARAQDLKSTLQEYAELPTSAPGARPVWHLAALAVLGDIERLRFYQKCFEVGDNCGFVPFITKDYIDRALSLAQRFSSSS